MKLLIGTLYSGENEFDECVISIKKQTFKEYEHLIFKNLPNKEAHCALFTAFIEKRKQFDLLIKVDADMVLTSPTLFAAIVERMQRNSVVDILSIAVQDFFSGELIQGLNTYRNTVRWDFDQETMFVDIPSLVPGRHIFDRSHLAPAAIHCKNPSFNQAFHYGVHRGFKSIQDIHSTSHWALLEKTWGNFLHNGDVRIGLAVLGAELVYRGEFTKQDVDYTNPKVAQVLERYQHLDSSAIKREILKYRLLNWGFLPGDLRRRLLRHKHQARQPL